MSSRVKKKTCAICVEEVNERNFYKCKNGECNLDACLTCIKTYLLSSSNEPHCMNCKNIISVEDFVDMFPKSWRLGAYKEHTKTILWAKEQSNMNITQSNIEVEHLIEKEYEKIHELNREIGRCQDTIRNLKYGNTGKNKKINNYIYKCPTENCNGSLNKSYACVICNKDFCKDCFEEINNDKVNNEHTCNEEKKATVSQIKKEANPCPNCGEMISKIDGCFGENTPIMMVDGSIKMSQDIKVNDILYGDDGTPRVVEEVFNGYDRLYKIIQDSGMDYIVNSKHKLILLRESDTNKTDYKSIYNEENKWIVKYLDNYEIIVNTFDDKGNAYNYYNLIDKPELYEITAEDYIKISYITNLKGVSMESHLREISHKYIVRKTVKIRDIGEGMYYGFRISGNHRFLLSDLTVVSNCSQIFCTQCGTAFNWRTGEIETGVIHNPHAARYFQDHPEARETYMNRIRNGANNECGINQYNLSDKMRKLHIRNNQVIYDIQTLCRNIYNYRNGHNVYGTRFINPEEPNNEDYRRKWITNEITDDHFKKVVFQRYKRYNKQVMDGRILNMTIDIMTDLLRKLVDANTEKEFMAIWNVEIKELVNYINDELIIVGNYYNLQPIEIDYTFSISN